MACAVLLGAAVFSTFSLIIACIVKTLERFMGIGQMLTMPLFFASNAMYPIAIMPDWLKAVAHVNPLTYEVDAMRALMIQGGATAFGLGADFAVLLLALAVLTTDQQRGCIQTWRGNPPLKILVGTEIKIITGAANSARAPKRC